MANLFYRNTNAKISFEILDEDNNLVGISTLSSVKWYIQTPDNKIISNDVDVSTHTYDNGVGIYTNLPAVQQQQPGIYYINYVLTKVGLYKYKFQILDDPTLVNLALAGEIKVINDGIF